MPSNQKKASWIAGEFFGTFLLVFFGCGSVASAVTTGAFSGIFQVAIVWGLGIATAIYLTGSLSGAHLNPAVTITLAVVRDFPARRISLYLGSQFSGAFAAAFLLYLLFGDAIQMMEAAAGITRGATGSEASAMVFAEFFPNPSGKPLAQAAPIITHLGAFFVEFVGTAVLLLVILCVTDDHNSSIPRPFIPAAIGLTVSCLICLFGPLTMAGFNPARDLAPRVFTSLVGWGDVAFLANGYGWLTVYVLAPVLGGVTGGLCYRLFFLPRYRPEVYLETETVGAGPAVERLTPEVSR